MKDKPDIAEILPHAPPMVLLDEVLADSTESITCALTVRADQLFDKDGTVPSWLGIEYMAQAVAAFTGLENWRQGQAIKVGFLLGTRRFNTDTDTFRVDQRLEITAERVIQGSNGMAAFDCSVRGEGVNQHATLSVYEPTEADAVSMISGEQA
ncbi:3-hydroxylacyl-ACP dehydratase [Pseudohalioglobus sediminis]|uniref:3-hydroxylacyl-ACP dehydratase n=1 Tax=Pseudohalioglobus sediminis TaxID=2606449 RepID=A0A5B0WTT4_9GAMM|nr:3-hydroxylacyl-ACP dehydratase [Pseudohalioglobus sediminis]KAA1190494.1 3-hydroxylacyl-ACP dehydratase [Pseudohalioglobus sediminis]